MKENRDSKFKLDENVFTALSVGFFFVLIGLLFISTPNLFEKTIDFITDFELKNVPNSELMLPAPGSINNHVLVYPNLVIFSFALGLFQILILVLRFLTPSTWNKRVDVVGNLVFWLGTGFLIQNFLVETTQWFVFLSLLLIIGGISLISRAIILTATRL